MTIDTRRTKTTNQNELSRIYSFFHLALMLKKEAMIPEGKGTIPLANLWGKTSKEYKVVYHNKKVLTEGCYIFIFMTSKLTWILRTCTKQILKARTIYNYGSPDVETVMWMVHFGKLATCKPVHVPARNVTFYLCKPCRFLAANWRHETLRNVPITLWIEWGVISSNGSLFRSLHPNRWVSFSKGVTPIRQLHLVYHLA